MNLYLHSKRPPFLHIPVLPEYSLFAVWLPPHRLRFSLPPANHLQIQVQNLMKLLSLSLFFLFHEGYPKLHCMFPEVLTQIITADAAGATPRRANIPGEQEYAGKGVSYCAICDGSFYRGKSVAVLGGGDTALDDAVYLADVAEKVYVIHRRKEFRGAAVTVAKLREKENVIFVLEHQVKEIIGEQKVTGVVLEDAAVIDVNGVFVAYGAVPQTDLLKKFAVLDDSGYVRAGETGETALEGLYVAGDARTKKLRQVVTAVSDGANAATAVAEYLK